MHHHKGNRFLNEWSTPHPKHIRCPRNHFVKHDFTLWGQNLSSVAWSQVCIDSSTGKFFTSRVPRYCWWPWCPQHAMLSVPFRKRVDLRGSKDLTSSLLSLPSESVPLGTEAEYTPHWQLSITEILEPQALSTAPNISNMSYLIWRSLHRIVLNFAMHASCSDVVNLLTHHPAHFSWGF